MSQVAMASIVEVAEDKSVITDFIIDPTVDVSAGETAHIESSLKYLCLLPFCRPDLPHDFLSDTCHG